MRAGDSVGPITAKSERLPHITWRFHVTQQRQTGSGTGSHFDFNIAVRSTGMASPSASLKAASASPPTPANNTRTDSRPRKKTVKAIPGIAQLLVLGLVFHLVYIATVFDCYFTSPVVHGMQRYKVEGPGAAPTAKAKRVVLIVGNGCSLHAPITLSYQNR